MSLSASLELVVWTGGSEVSVHLPAKTPGLQLHTNFNHLGLVGASPKWKGFQNPFFNILSVGGVVVHPIVFSPQGIAF